MLDKPGNILFVFNNQNTGTHTPTVMSQSFCRVTGRLNVGFIFHVPAGTVWWV
jgi:hypothetical protein